MALTANEKLISKELLLQYLCITRKLSGTRISRKLMLHGLLIRHILAVKWMQINLQPDVNLDKNPDRKSEIEDFTEDECWNFFETRKQDLLRLQRALRIPQTVVFDIMGNR